VTVYLLVGTEATLCYHCSNEHLSRVKYYQCIVSCLKSRVARGNESLLTLYLKNWLLQIFLNQHVFYAEGASLRGKDAEFALETTDANLVSRRLDIIYVADANTTLVELLVLTH